MSDKKTSKDKEPAADSTQEEETGNSGAAGEAEDASFDAIEEQAREAFADEVPMYESSPRGVKWSSAAAWLGLIIAVTALLVSGYLALTGGDAEEASAGAQDALSALSVTLDETRSSLSDSRAAVEQLQDRLSRLAESDSSRGKTLASLEQQLADSLQRIGSLPGRVSNLESSIASLQGISSGVRDTWLIREAEYYMQIANAQLQLAGNPQLAILALRLADERVVQLADPATTEVRRALSDELRALETMDSPDLVGIALTLASLAGVVDSLPVRQELEIVAAASEEIDPEISGMDRAMASLRKTVDDVVSIRRTDEAIRPLIAPEAQFFLRANLSLQLQAARLALLRSEQQLFEQSLDDASAWLNEYYDAESAPVRSALATIAEVRTSSFSVTLPDISGSLRLLRQYEALATGAVEPDDDSAPATEEENPQ